MSTEYDDIITGRIFADPDHKTSGAGNPFCKFTLSKSERKENGDYGPTLWVKCVAFKTAAKDMRDYSKGSIVRLYGKLGMGDPWEGKDGVKRQDVEMKVFKVEAVVRGARGASAAPSAPKKPATPKPAHPACDDEDVPF